MEASQVLLSNQYLHSLSHCGHITILPPMSGSHTSLLRDGGQENGVRGCFFFFTLQFVLSRTPSAETNLQVLVS